MQYFDGNSGFITVITGPMFSEKSGELIKRCEKMQKYGRKVVKAYKPKKDNRFSEDEIISRMGYRLPATNIPEEITADVIEQILIETESADVIAFDEAQFFSKNIMKLVNELAYRNKHVLIDGLNMDYRGKEFGFIGGLMAMADEVVKLTAYCATCGNSMGTHTQRLVNGNPAKIGPIVLIGDSEKYEPRCRKCFTPPDKVNQQKNEITKRYKVLSAFSGWEDNVVKGDILTVERNSIKELDLDNELFLMKGDKIITGHNSIDCIKYCELVEK